MYTPIYFGVVNTIIRFTDDGAVAEIASLSADSNDVVTAESGSETLKKTQCFNWESC